MPIDADGNRAEIIMDGIGTINRANPGRLFEQYYNSASRDLHKEICRTLNIQPFTRQSTAFNIINTTAKEMVDHAFTRLYHYYQLTSPQMSGWFDNGQIEATKEEYLSEIVEKGISLFIPPDNQPITQDVVVELEKHYRPCYGPVSYVGNSGKRVTTVNDVRIGEMYVILLEKIGDDWSGISSGKFQLFGVLSQLTRDDKYSKPSRAQAVRGAGEAENRSFITYVGPWFFSEFMDRNNNPRTHAAMVDGLLEADKPGNVKNLVDRRTIPYGGSKPLVLLKHTMQVGGIAFVCNKHKPNYGSTNGNYVYNSISTK